MFFVEALQLLGDFPQTSTVSLPLDPTGGLPSHKPPILLSPATLHCYRRLWIQVHRMVKTLNTCRRRNRWGTVRKTAAAVVSGSSERDVVVSREPGLSVAPTASSMCTDAQRLQTLSRRHSQNTVIGSTRDRQTAMREASWRRTAALKTELTPWAAALALYTASSQQQQQQPPQQIARAVEYLTDWPTECLHRRTGHFWRGLDRFCP